MRTVGDSIRDARLSKNLSTTELEEKTRIRKEYIEALEESAYEKLPPSTFVKGFIRNLAVELELNVSQVLALYRREFDEKEEKASRLAPEPLYGPRVRITPKSALAGGLVLFFLLFFGYLYREYYTFAGAPLLVVTHPPDQAHIPGSTITVSGKTYPDAKVEINDQEILVAPDGTFQTEMKSNQSITTIRVTATNKRGRKSETTRTVRVLNPEG